MSIGISEILSIGQSLVERVWPDPQKQEEEKRKLVKLAQDGDIAELNAQVQILTGQMRINEQEAKHKSLFVSGWRPFVGWVGGVGLAYMAVIEPLFRFFATMLGYNGDFPVLDSSLTLQVLMGMLGIGAMRSFDKAKGVQTDAIKKPSK